MMIMKRNIETLLAAAILLLAMLAFAYAEGSFRFFGPLRRVVSPNGDGKNDQAVFCFDNPERLAVAGSVYTLLGSHVADFGQEQRGASACAAATIGGTNFMTWDGKAGGVVVRSGVYIYKLRAEGTSFTGTLLVVR
jgi:hypothetical protein